jgi:hypothetical protein
MRGINCSRSCEWLRCDGEGESVVGGGCGAMEREKVWLVEWLRCDGEGESVVGGVVAVRWRGRKCGCGAMEREKKCVCVCVCVVGGGGFDMLRLQCNV